MLAVRDLNLKASEQLLAYGADPNSRDEDGTTLLMWVAMCGGGRLKKNFRKYTVPIAELLIDKGANINAKDNMERTPLLYAAAENTFELVFLYIQSGADLYVRDEFGRNALMLAYLGRRLKIARYLIEIDRRRTLLLDKDIWGRGVGFYRQFSDFKRHSSPSYAKQMLF